MLEGNQEVLQSQQNKGLQKTESVIKQPGYDAYKNALDNQKYMEGQEKNIKVDLSSVREKVTEQINKFPGLEDNIIVAGGNEFIDDNLIEDNIIGERLIKNAEEQLPVVLTNLTIDDASIQTAHRDIGKSGDPSKMWKRRDACLAKKQKAMDAFRRDAQYKKQLKNWQDEVAEDNSLVKSDDVEKATMPLQNFNILLDDRMGFVDKTDKFELNDTKLTTDQYVNENLAHIEALLPSVEQALRGTKKLMENGSKRYANREDYLELKDGYDENMIRFEAMSKVAKYRKLRIELLQNRYYILLAGKDTAELSADELLEKSISEAQLSDSEGSELARYYWLLSEMKKMKDDGMGAHTNANSVYESIKKKINAKTYKNFETDLFKEYYENKNYKKQITMAD